LPLKYIACLVFVSVLLLILGFYRPAMSDQREFSRRIARVLKKKEKNEISPGISGIKQLLNGFIEGLKNIISATPLKKWVEKELARADLPLRAEEFLLFTILGIVLASLALLMFTGSFVLMTLVLVVLLPLPYLTILRAKQQRLVKFSAQIGDALVIIANSLRSGFSFLQAMDLVRKEMPDPIAREFGRTFQEISLGTPTEQALQNMAERVGSDDLDMVVTAVLIQRQVGGNLAEVLDNIAHTIRERIRIKGEIKTLTAQGRISGLIVGLLPTALTILLFAINPKYISLLFTTTPGLLMLGAAFIAQATGFLIINKIVDIKY